MPNKIEVAMKRALPDPAGQGVRGRLARAPATAPRSASGVIGFRRKSVAPSRMASTASCGAGAGGTPRASIVARIATPPMLEPAKARSPSTNDW